MACVLAARNFSIWLAHLQTSAIGGRWRSRKSTAFSAGRTTPEFAPASKRRGLAVVAEALNKGELARAQIAALLLRLPDPVLSKLDPDAREVELAALRESGLLAKDWDEADHPRTGMPPNPGWFAPKDEAGADQSEGGRRSGGADRSRGEDYAFAGVLIDRRYDEIANITHCIYRTPLRDFTLEIDGNSQCEPTHPYPYTF